MTGRHRRATPWPRHLAYTVVYYARACARWSLAHRAQRTAVHGVVLFALFAIL